MAPTTPSPVRSVRAALPRQEQLLIANLRLQAEVAALIEDNKQLRAALRIFSEVARQSPATLSIELERAA